MKKIIIILTAFIMSTSLMACGGVNDLTNSSENITSSVSNIVKVSFDYNGGVRGENDPLFIELEKGQAISQLPEPTKEACIFQGWWKGDIQLTTSLTINENIKFMAKWEDEPLPEYDGYLISFHLDEHVEVVVYQDKACLVPDMETVYQTRNNADGKIGKADAFIIFSIEFDEGFALDLIKFEQSDGAWPGNLMAPSETATYTNKDNCYLVTQITANGTLTIASKVKI